MPVLTSLRSLSKASSDIGDKPTLCSFCHMLPRANPWKGFRMRADVRFNFKGLTRASVMRGDP